MSRRQAREVALQALFQLDFNPCEEGESQAEAREAAIAAATAEMEEELYKRDRAFVLDLVNGTMDNLSAIDEVISDHSAEWKLERMMGVDRNIVRMAVYELNFGAEEIDSKIVVNEAVELAKKFGTDDSYRFINGVLAAIMRK